MRDAKLLLLARDDDSAIGAFRRAMGNRVVHASIADLSCAGWRYVSGCPEEAIACADGRVIVSTQIAAVLCRIACVTSADLTMLHADDREYAAAEMTAFLRAWLDQFQCVRCNEPTWMSLAGPGWHPLHWTWLVSNLGMPVIGAARAVEVERMHCQTATVSGSEVFGVADPTLIEYSLRIARAMRARSLAIRFVNDGEWRFVSADPRPDLDAITAAALWRDVCASRTDSVGRAESATLNIGRLLDQRAIA